MSLKMTSNVAPADELFHIVASNDHSSEEKLELINQLKAHVKKEYVDIKQVPKYLEALSIAVDISDWGISASSFSVLCHLVKRVSMQDKSGEVLKSQGYLILPIIINRMNDSKTSTINSAKRALEACWLSTPQSVEDTVIDLGMSHRNSKIVTECVRWLHHIVKNINTHFKLNRFLPHIIKLLRGNPEKKNTELIDSVRGLLVDYYSYQHNQLYKFDLERELEFQSIDLGVRDSIMKAMASDIKENTHSNYVLSGSTRVVVNARNDINKPDFVPENKSSLKDDASIYTHERNTKKVVNSTQKKNPSMPQSVEVALPSLTSNVTSDTLSESNIDLSPEIQKIIGSSNFSIDNSIEKLNISNVNKFYDIVNNILPAFDNKETEFNWSAREKGVIQLRRIIRGNLPVDYTSDLISCFRNIATAICKAITSLRTTLCINGCQLIRESAIILKEKFDPLADLFLPTLIKLCSATKNIASSNANSTICAIFLNISFTHKSFQRITSCSNEKNVSPRSYSGLWLQILIYRFHDGPFSAPLSGTPGITGIEASCKILSRILGDPNPSVRSVAKDCFWSFQSKFPEAAKQMLGTLDTKIIKAIERSRPKNKPMILDKSISEKIQPTRPSIREAIRNKYKDVRPHRDSPNNSQPSSRSTSGLSMRSNDIKSIDRVHSDTSKRVISKSMLNRVDDTKESSVKPVATPNYEFSQNHETMHIDNEPEPESKPEPQSIKEEKSTNQSEPSNNKDVARMSFDKQSDPILKFLSSNQIDLIKEGINLLKYAIMGEEDLSTEINELLRVISIREPMLLQPLFLSSETLLKRSYQFFAAEDFFRVCTILVKPVEDGFVKSIISIADVDEIYQSFIKLLSYCVSISNIDDDGELSMQIIRFKSTIIGMIIEFMMKGLDKIPISDSYFSKVTANMLELVGLVKSTDLYSSFSNVLKKMYSINPVLFTSELDLTDNNTNDEVRFIIGIDTTLDFSTNIGYDNNLTSLMNLTKVIPSKDIDRFSPVKVSTDFTMIVPMLKDDLSITNSNNRDDAMSHSGESTSQTSKDSFLQKSAQAKEIPSEDEYRDQEMEQHDDFDAPGLARNGEAPSSRLVSGNIQSDIHLGNSTARVKKNINEKLHDVDYESTKTDDMDVDKNEDQNQTDSIRTKTPPREKNSKRTSNSDYFDKERNCFLEPGSSTTSSKSGFQSKYHENSDDLVEDFAQVNLGELSKTDNPEANQFQNILEKIDPINKISGKNKPIAIFQDSKERGSPQKVRDYNYSENNWFNFQVAKYSLEGDYEYDNRSGLSQDNFGVLCDRLSTNQIEGKEFISLLNYLQAVETSSFGGYFHSEGQEMVIRAILKFFNVVTSDSQSKIHSALIILKQLFILRVPVNLDSVWDVFIKLLNQWPSDEELYFALMDTFDEMLCGIYSTQELINKSLNYITSSGVENGDHTLVFALESLNKILSSQSISLLIDQSIIRDLDKILSRYLEHTNVEVRRLVVLGYARILKASGYPKSGEIKADKSEEAKLIDGILLRCSVPQKKLIEYYSQV